MAADGLHISVTVAMSLRIMNTMTLSVRALILGSAQKGIYSGTPFRIRSQSYASSCRGVLFRRSFLEVSL